MDKKIKEKWVKALRSGDYEQGRGMLCCITEQGAKYCCLGVLAEVVEGEDAWEIDPSAKYRTMDGNRKDYGWSVGLANAKIIKLMRMNDLWRHTFEQLANYIEENL